MCRCVASSIYKETYIISSPAKDSPATLTIIGTAQKELKPDIKSINTISKNLLALSKRDSVKDRTKKTFTFLKSVNDDIAAARKASKAAQEKAEKKIEGQKTNTGSK